MTTRFVIVIDENEEAVSIGLDKGLSTPPTKEACNTKAFSLLKSILKFVEMIQQGVIPLIDDNEGISRKVDEMSKELGIDVKKMISERAKREAADDFKDELDMIIDDFSNKTEVQEDDNVKH